MAEITSAQLNGDTFNADQGSYGSASGTMGGPYTYSSNGSLGSFGNSITITSTGVPATSETFTATINGGFFSGAQGTGTIVANDSSDILANVTFDGQSYYVYVTNNPAAQPAQGQSIPVGAIGPNNPYTFQAACFASGTRIRTERGEVAVDELRVGDLVATAAGAHRPVRWLGHRTLRPLERAEPWSVNPVRISAGAFGVGLPERDLFLSPGHPVLVGAEEDGEDGHLVPIMCLVNGTTVRRVAVETVTYWHVELDAHDILLAEGLQSESYLDCGDRAFFTEGVDHALANPDFVVPGLAGRCRPVALDGPVVEAERRRLDALFATRLAGACAWPDPARAEA